jgi:hypothetical protein
VSAGPAAVLAILLVGLVPRAGWSQGYRLRLDSRLQTVTFRGVSPDSIDRAAAGVGSTGGLFSPEGFAVTCPAAGTFCHFYRPGPRLTSTPLVSYADLTAWGLGAPGLSLRGSVRWGTDLSSGNLWPGTRPAIQLLEGYAEYARGRLTGRLGRQHVTGRLGWTGMDGAALTLRSASSALDVTAYGGWGLARGVDLPVTSPSLNPLEDYQLPRRQVTAGVVAGWRSRAADLRAEYRREIDPSADAFVSERAALTMVARPSTRFSVTGGAEYDLAQGWWGTSDVTLWYDSPVVSVDGGVRRYRPYFELWTIWGAFSPVPYTALDGSISFAPVRRFRLRATGEQYWFDGSGAETGLGTFEDRGWRVSLAATMLALPSLTLDLGYHEEFGPGAASRSWDGRATWLPAPALSLAAFGSSSLRPLELRFDEAHLDAVGVDAGCRLSERLEVAVSGAQYFEDRRRPDAGAFDWNQFRLQLRATWLLGSDADRLRLPPALRGVRPRAGQ